MKHEAMNVRRVIRAQRLLAEQGHAGDTLGALDELAALRKDAERYRKMREAGSALKLYVYEDQADPCSGDWQYKPSPEDVDAFADGLGAA